MIPTCKQIWHTKQQNQQWTLWTWYFQAEWLEEGDYRNAVFEDVALQGQILHKKKTQVALHVALPSRKH